jgi:hypothetical protein
VIACAAYVVAGQVPDLRSPLLVTNARFFADGGSTWIAITDAAGKQIAFGVRGSLDRDAVDFPVYLQRWYPIAPLPVPVDRNSHAGQALLEVVERAGRDGGALAVQELAPVRIALSNPSKHERH